MMAILFPSLAIVWVYFMGAGLGAWPLPDIDTDPVVIVETVDGREHRFEDVNARIVGGGNFREPDSLVIRKADRKVVATFSLHAVVRWYKP